MTIVELWAGGASKIASMAGKANTAKTLSQFSNTVWWAADMWLRVLENKALSSINKISNPILRKTAKLATIPMNKVQTMKDVANSNIVKKPAKILSELVSWFSEAEKKWIQNNPYMAEYWDSAVNSIDIEWKPPTTQELIRQPLQELWSSLLEKIETYESSLSYAWEWYNKIKQLNNAIDITPAHATISNILNKYDIKVNSKWDMEFFQ